MGIVLGDLIRDWQLDAERAVWLYDEEFRLIPISALPETKRFFWPYRVAISRRKRFGTPMLERGLTWYEYQELYQTKLQRPLSIPFAFVATHNHFVLDRGGKVFNRSAPVIKLPAGATEADHLALIGLLNSSTACFWMKQVFHNKGSTVDTRGARQTTDAFENFYEFTGTGLKKFPIPDVKPLDLATELDRIARERQAYLPSELVGSLPLSRADLDSHRADAASLLRRMITLQEELDWRCYRFYGVTEEDLTVGRIAAGGATVAGESAEPVPGSALRVPEIGLGERAFELLMARQMTKGELETTWFERHRSKPITEIPKHWPEDYRNLVEQRIALIESDRSIGLVERPEYKRRWNQEPWEEQEKRTLRGWLLDRLEQDGYWPEPRLQTARSLAERAATDTDFMQVAELYVGHPGFDVTALVGELVEDQSVPFLPVLRYKPSGLRKRAIWEQSWQLQRQEDAIDARVAAELTRIAGETDEEYESRLASEQRKRKKAEVGDIASPPKYRSTDFLSNGGWRRRGPLDVPKERFVSYPHCSRANDPSLVIAWAGWDHLQQAQAVAGYYTEMVEQEGWQAERLRPLLAGLGELLPWLKQWHNDIDPTFNERMGDFFETFLRSELQKHGLTREDLAAWEPPSKSARRGRRRA